MRSLANKLDAKAKEFANKSLTIVRKFLRVEEEEQAKQQISVLVTFLLTRLKSILLGCKYPPEASLRNRNYHLRKTTSEQTTRQRLGHGFLNCNTVKNVYLSKRNILKDQTNI